MVVQLVEGVWWLELTGVNAYLVADDELTLVDAGTPWDATAIRAGIQEAGFALDAVERVLLTHYDLDHAGGLARLTPDLDAPVRAGSADAAILRGTRRPALWDRKGLFQRVTGPLVRRPDLPIEPVADGESVGSFTAFHTPGHTAGHTAFVSADLAAAMLGDLVRSRGNDLVPAPWVLSRDTDRLQASIRSLADRAPPFEVACPGHGRPLRSGGRAALAATASGR